MTSTPAAQIASVLELDGKRSQGEWKSSSTENGGVIQSYVNGKLESNVAVTTICGFGHTQYTMPNAAFIASDPLMAQIIREQQEVIKQLVGALSDCQSTMNICATDGNSNVRQENEQANAALALAKPLLAEQKPTPNTSKE